MTTRKLIGVLSPLFVILSLTGCQGLTDRVADRLIVDVHHPETRVYRGQLIMGGLANIAATHVDEPDAALAVLVEIGNMRKSLNRATQFVFDGNQFTKLYADVPFVHFAKSSVRAARIGLPIKEFRDLANQGIAAVGSQNPALLAVTIARFLARNIDSLILVAELRESAQKHFDDMVDEETKADGSKTWKLKTGRPNAQDSGALAALLGLGCFLLAETAVQSDLAPLDSNGNKSAKSVATKFCGQSPFDFGM